MVNKKDEFTQSRAEQTLRVDPDTDPQASPPLVVNLLLASQTRATQGRAGVNKINTNKGSPPYYGTARSAPLTAQIFTPKTRRFRNRRSSHFQRGAHIQPGHHPAGSQGRVTRGSLFR